MAALEETRLEPNLIANLRDKSPLVYHLTNFVTVNDCANITLAIGASPVMSLSPEEAASMASFASALVLNMGTPDQASLDSMLAAGAIAKDRGIPIIFDPVGVGATPYRQAYAKRIMDEVKPTIVKGNVAEIRFLAGQAAAMRGVDSLDKDGAGPACLELARQRGCIALATGAIDYVSDGSEIWAISGGCVLLGQVCGTGCMTASLAGSFAGSGVSALQAALGASLTMKLAGEHAAMACGHSPAETIPSSSKAPGPVGLGSFRIALHDAVCALTDADIKTGDRIQRVQQ
jgi:hydroxyethylthiazole kinase